MADNTTLSAGTADGAIIATDETAAGSIHYQVVKLADGTADSTTVIAVDVGAKANAIRTAPANDITDATYIGDIKFGEELPAGTQLIGKTGIDQTTPGTTNLVSIGTDGTVGINVELPAGTQNIGNVDIVTLPAGNLGQQAMAASLSIVPASDIADATYIGDIKFGEALVAGTAKIGLVSQDETLADKSSSQDLSGAPLSYTTNFAADTKISYITLHADGAITETVTISIDSAAGANYDTVIASASLTADTDYIWIPDSEFIISSGDEIIIQCTDNGGAQIVYVVCKGVAK